MEVGVGGKHLEYQTCKDIRSTRHTGAGVVHQNLANQLAEVINQAIADEVQVSWQELVWPSQKLEEPCTQPPLQKGSTASRPQLVDPILTGRECDGTQGLASRPARQDYDEASATWLVLLRDSRRSSGGHANAQTQAWLARLGGTSQGS